MLLHCSLILVLPCILLTLAEHCPEECKTPSFATQPPSITELEAETEASCFSACVDLLSTVCNCEISIVPSVEDLGLWKTLMDNGKIHCASFRKVSDCQRGCSAKARNSSQNCSQTCMENCPSSYDGLSESTCNTECNPLFCNHGCQIYDDYLSNSTNESEVDHNLPAPKYEPNVSSDSSDDPRDGIFLYSTSHPTGPTTATVPSDGPSDNDVTFVFKITTQNTTAYIWKWEYVGYIDLDFASCQETNVSFKAVSRHSSTTYSPITHICGESQYPKQINSGKDLKFYVTEDFRPGFEAHAIINISWTPPEGAQFLTHYVLEVLSQTVKCGGAGVNHKYEIDKDATSFTLKSVATTDPASFQCLYVVRLISKPQSPQFNTQPPSFASLNPQSVSGPNPTIQLSCQLHRQLQGKIDLAAIWSVTDYPGLIEATMKYQAHVQVTKSTDIVPMEWRGLVEIYPNGSEPLNVAIFTNLEPLDTDHRYAIRIDAISNGMFPWRQMPSYVTCVMDAEPIPPQSINGSTIKLYHLDFNENFLFLNVSWDFPPVINGIASNFEVRIAREFLESNEIDDPTDYSLRQYANGNVTFIEINATQVYRLASLTCLYLQIRCENNYNLWSGWSEPLVLQKYPYHDPDCMGLHPPEPTASTSTIIINRNSVDYLTTPIGDIPPGDKEGGLSIGVVGGIVALVIGICLCSLFGVIVVILVRRYRRRNRYLEAFKEFELDPMYVTGGLTGDMPPDSICTTKLLNSPVLDEWEIPAGQVIIENRLGEGCFGEVYQGTIKGPINNSKVQSALKNTICPVVAVKLLKPTATGRERVDFLQEIDTMKRVAKGNNPHVVNMVGCVTIQEPLCLITEFIKYGDLSSYLKSIRQTIMEKRQNAKSGNGAEPYLVPQNDAVDGDDLDTDTELTPSMKDAYSELGDVDNINLLSFAYQIASGMEYLASTGIVHRDLACRNILVGEGRSLKISDFGMSRVVEADDVYVKNTKGRLPWKWMAIESIVNREFTTASDVWSYGVVIWEIATLGGFPYPTIPNADLLEHLQRGLRLEKPNNCSSEVYEIILECWNSNPSERPTFTELRGKFDGLISAQKDHNPYIDLDIDCQKSYYNPLLVSDDEGEGDTSSSGVSTESSSGSPPQATIMRTRFGGNISCEDLPRPISNPYVDSPTNHVRSHSMAFAEQQSADYARIDFSRARIGKQELKGSVQLTDFV